MGKGKTLTQKDASEIWEMYLKGPKGAAKQLCEMKGYHKTTYYKILNCEGDLGIHYHRKELAWNQNQIDASIGFIEQVNPQVTLEDLRDIMVGHFNFPSIGISTLWRYLDGELITLKLATFHNQMRNALTTRMSRRDYSNFFLAHQQFNYFYIDECGFSLNTTRRVARAERGQQAVVHEARNKGRNISIIACVNKDIGLVSYDYKDGSINSEDFISFLNVMLSSVYEKEISNPVLIFDNARIHQKDDIQRWCDETGWDYIFLPPYSPMLNIIEECFSVLKNSIKKLLAGPYNTVKMNIAYMPYGQKDLNRRKLLEKVLIKSIPEITQEKVMAFWGHMMSFLPKCINLEII